jgi:hypothetical protein
MQYAARCQPCPQRAQHVGSSCKMYSTIHDMRSVFTRALSDCLRYLLRPSTSPAVPSPLVDGSVRDGLPRVLDCACAVLPRSVPCAGSSPNHPSNPNDFLSCNNIAAHHLVKPVKPSNKARMRFVPFSDMPSTALGTTW